MTRLQAEALRSESNGPPASIDKLTASASVPVAGNDLWVFAESDSLIDALLVDIRTARTRVWLETYIFVDDSAGQAVAAVLQERAAAGLDVRVLYDAIGSQATSSAFFDAMRSGGVEVHAYRTVWDVLSRHSWLKFFRIMNRRDHRKIMVVDDHVAYFGGMNIVDQSGQPKEKAPMSSGWRDVHVRLIGPQQGEIAASFERSWRRANHQRVARRGASMPRSELSTENESIRFFDCGPHFRRSRALKIFSSLIRAAKRSILLSMAYFIPTRKVLRELYQARRRAVRIQTIVPGESDVKLVQWAARHMYSKLLAHGIEIHERQERMLHSKVMVVDDQWTVVGSCNLDPRSLFINHEFLAVIRSAAFATTMAKICAHELQHSSAVTCDGCAQRSWWQRLLDRAAYSVRWFL